MPAQTVIIKKYENRRLYDTSNSRYVNLEDIAQMVREGTDIQIVDALSGEDLTRMVLTQIIAENAKVPNSAFPLDMLRQMVIASGQMSQEGLVGYMKAMSLMYQNTYRAFAPTPPFDFTPKEAPASPVPPAPQQNETLSVEDLQRRIEDLERIVERNAADKKNTKSKGNSRQKQR